MIYPWEINRLKVQRFYQGGCLLADKSDASVFLPGTELTQAVKLDELLDVFVYRQGNQLLATLRHPAVQAHEFACLPVVRTDAKGIWLDWGWDHPVCLPANELTKPGEGLTKLIVFLLVDETTGMLSASAKINRYLSKEAPDVVEGEEVDLLVFEKTFLGYNAIINQHLKGLLYHSELFQPLVVGDRMRGYVKKIREDDSIDLSMQRSGIDHLFDESALLLQRLKEADGFLPFTDDSAPEAIRAGLNMSKKTFKRAVGILYKKKWILLQTDGIRLNPEQRKSYTNFTRDGKDKKRND